MSQGSNIIVEYGELIVAGILAISTITLGILNFRRKNKIQKLEDENEYLKKEIHKVSSKVNPESDRKLIIQARENIQIMGINSLGPLHHCREEIIEFLKNKTGLLQIILLDPGSEIFREREEKEEDISGRLFSEWRASISILKDIQNHSGGQIQLRLRSDPPDRSLLIVDSGTSLTDRCKMLINYYPAEPGMRGYSGTQFLSEFIMERDRDSIFKNNNYFSECWKRSRPITIDAAMQMTLENR